MRLYILILEGLADKQELEEYYTLEEALKLYALYEMRRDIEEMREEEAKQQHGRR